MTWIKFKDRRINTDNIASYRVENGDTHILWSQGNSTVFEGIHVFELLDANLSIYEPVPPGDNNPVINLSDRAKKLVAERKANRDRYQQEYEREIA